MASIGRGLSGFDELRPRRVNDYDVDGRHEYLEKTAAYLGDCNKGHYYTANSVFRVLYIASGGRHPHCHRLKNGIYMYGTRYLKNMNTTRNGKKLPYLKMKTLL